MKDIYKNWDFEKFITFMMYHAAQADFVLTQEEREMILKRIGLDEYNELRTFHKQNSDYENIQVILYFKNIFLEDKENLDRVYEAMNNVFNADGEFSIHEKNMMKAFHLLLS
jgi:hypothetical protein